MSSNLINTSKAITNDIAFPQKEDLINYTVSFIPVPAAIRIPLELLVERQGEQSNTGTILRIKELNAIMSFVFSDIAIPIVFIIFSSLDSFLPTPTGGLSNTTQGASVVISSQVGERGNGRSSQTLRQSPLSLNFTFDVVSNNQIFCHSVTHNYYRLKITNVIAVCSGTFLSRMLNK